MLRWHLSTVRTSGGYDSNIRLSSFISSRISRCSRTYTNATLIVGLAKRPDGPVVTSFVRGHAAVSQGVSFGHAPSLEDRHYPWKPSCPRTSHSAIDALVQFLSSKNITSDKPILYSPATIRSLYFRAETRNQLGMLDCKMLTFLMGLFGSLSVEAYTPIVYDVPLSSHLSRMSTRRTHWVFVLKVGKYKLQRGMTLQDSDRFWLMRAELEILQAKLSSGCSATLSNDAYSAILRARIHYHIIRRHSRRPEVHAYYLESLLAIRDPRLLDLAACDLAFVLRTHRVCRPWLQHLLHRLVIQHGSSLSTLSQEAILKALWSRVCQGFTGLVPEDSLSNIVLHDSIKDATTLAHSLSTTLFAFSDHHSRDVPVASLGQLLSVFSPVYALPLRWSSLSSFSVFNAPEALHYNGIQWTSNPAMPQMTLCWQVIFGLAVVEKTLRGSLSSLKRPAHTEDILESARTLYRLWLPITRSNLVSQDLACALATSFLGIAGFLADVAFLNTCRNLYHVGASLNGPRASIHKFYVARYIAALLRVQRPPPDEVHSALSVFFPDLKQQQEILSLAIEALAPIDAPLASTLYVIAKGKEIKLGPRAIYCLAISLIRQGALPQAVFLFSDGRLSLQEREILISMTVRSLRKNPQARYPSSVFVAIVDELADLYNSCVPSEHFRGHLERLLVDLAQRGRGTQLIPVVLSIFKNSPSFFHARFIVRYCHVLLRRRQFATAIKLLDAIKVAHPKISRFLRILTNRITLQLKVSRTSKQTVLRGPTSLKLSSRLRCWPHSGLPLERSLQELLGAGRLLASKHIFARAAATIPPRRRTALGNILLHGVSRQPTPRNARRIRKVLALLENLVANHGFQPDRVTVNILIKTMVSWRSAFDSPRLRELFDQLVRGGYSAADYSPLHPPFGTSQTQVLDSSSVTKLSPFVSFERHSRPLFKMFIKAFYLCNDVEAARRVVGILKVEESRHAMAKKAREQARWRGSIQAAQRNVIPLDVNVSRN